MFVTSRDCSLEHPLIHHCRQIFVGNVAQEKDAVFQLQGLYPLEDALVVPAFLARNGQPAVCRVATLTLSCDHRVVDGATGASFLATLRELLGSATAL